MNLKSPHLDPALERFANRAIARQKLFLALSIIGVAVGAGLAAWFMWQRAVNPNFSLGMPLLVVVLVLLNARQNLRQFKYAKILKQLRDES